MAELESKRAPRMEIDVEETFACCSKVGSFPQLKVTKAAIGPTSRCAVYSSLYERNGGPMITSPSRPRKKDAVFLTRAGSTVWS